MTLLATLTVNVYRSRVMLFNAINTFNTRKPHQRSIHSVGSGSTLMALNSMTGDPDVHVSPRVFETKWD